jgi:hypothetical protein
VFRRVLVVKLDHLFSNIHSTQVFDARINAEAQTIRAYVPPKETHFNGREGSSCLMVKTVLLSMEIEKRSWKEASGSSGQHASGSGWYLSYRSWNNQSLTTTKISGKETSDHKKACTNESLEIHVQSMS